MTALRAPATASAATDGLVLPDWAPNVAIANGQVFESGGSDHLVHYWASASDPNPPTTVDVGSNVARMVASPDGSSIYLGLKDSRELAILDTSTKTISARYDTSAIGYPTGFALSGSRLYFVAYNPQSLYSVAVADVDLAAPPALTAVTTLGGYDSGALAVRADPDTAGLDDLYVAGCSPGGGCSVALWVTDGTTRTEVRHSFISDLRGFSYSKSDNLLELTEQPGQATLMDPTFLTRTATATLADHEEMAGTSSGRMVTVTCVSECVEMGVRSLGGASTATYARVDGQITPLLDPTDPSTLYGVTADKDGVSRVIAIADGLTTGDVLTAVGPPATVTPATAISVSGTLALTAGSVGGQSLTVARTNPDQSITVLDPVTTDSAGSYVIADDAVAGDSTYAVSWAGDGSHSPLIANTTVHARYSASLSVDTSVSGSDVTVSGVLSFPDGPADARTLTSHRIDPDASTQVQAPTVTEGNGSYSFVAQALPGTNRYVVKWAGDSTHRAATTTSAPVTVRYPVAMTGKTTVAPDGTVTMTGILNWTNFHDAPYGVAADQPLTVSRTNPNGTSTALPACATDGVGNILFRDKPAPGSYTYTVSAAATETRQSSRLTVAAVVPFTTSLTVSAPPAPVVPGAPLAVHGALTVQGGSPAGIALTVVRTNPNGTVTTIGHPVTGSAGAYTITDHPGAGTVYYTVSKAADSAHRASSARVRVFSSYPSRVSVTSTRSGTTMSASGAVCHVNAAGTCVRQASRIVVLQRWVSGSGWRNLVTTRTDRYGVYRFSASSTSRTTWRVLVPATADSRAALSPSFIR